MFRQGRNSSLKSVHGCTLFNSGTGGGGYPSPRLCYAGGRLWRDTGKGSLQCAGEGRRLEPETGFCGVPQKAAGKKMKQKDMMQGVSRLIFFLS